MQILVVSQNYQKQTEDQSLSSSIQWTLSNKSNGTIDHSSVQREYKDKM